MAGNKYIEEQIIKTGDKQMKLEYACYVAIGLGVWLLLDWMTV